MTEQKKVLVPDRDRPWNKQDVFNAVWERAKTKTRCISHYGKCLYREFDTNNNPVNACFAGICIPDSVYSPDLEMEGIWQAACDIVPQNLFENSVSVLFIMTLQKIHDQYSTDEWAEELRNFAKDNTLTVPE